MDPNKPNNKSLYIFFGIFAYLFFCFAGLHIGTVYEQNPSSGIVNSLMDGLEHLESAPFDIVITGSTIKALGLTTLLFALIVMYIVFDSEKNKRTLPGKESGSAAWNNDLKAYNKKYTDPKNSPQNNGQYNMILTQNVHLNMDTRVTRRNNNVVVIGGSGSGKSRFFVKPNILQSNTNYIITDPAGELLQATGGFLKEQGYEIKVFNLVEMSKSNCYNPFNYIRDDQGVLMMINCLIKNTNPPGKGSSDPFWEKSETALLQALCFYLIKYRPKEDQNFTSVMRLLRAAEINEQNPNAKSKLDRIFDEVEAKDPTSIAVKQYKTFKMGAGKTLKSILISCSVRLTVFNLRQIESLTHIDDIELGKMGEGKKALFVIIPAADNTYNFLVSMMYNQLFETLYYVAETQYQSKRLPRHVRFLLDEFANIGQIPEFTQKLATMRKYEISCNIILQNIAQLKAMYQDDWETIIGNCDTFCFLGGQEYSTLEYVSKELGDQTLTVRNRSMSIGKNKSSSKSFNTTGRKLMFPDEIARMDDANCILIIRGLKPFFDKKYDYTKHRNYPKTGDANAKYQYVNEINNMVYETSDELEEKYLDTKTAVYQSIRTQIDAEKIVSKPMSAETLAKTLGITQASQIFERFIAIAPDTVTINSNTETTNVASPNSAKQVDLNNIEKREQNPSPRTDFTPDIIKAERDNAYTEHSEAQIPHRKSYSESDDQYSHNYEYIEKDVSHVSEVKTVDNDTIPIIDYESVTPSKTSYNSANTKQKESNPVSEESHKPKISKKDRIPEEIKKGKPPTFDSEDSDGQEKWYFL